MEHRFNISVKLSDQTHTFYIYYHDRELYDFIKTELRALFVFSALTLEVVDADVVERCRVCVLVLLYIED